MKHFILFWVLAVGVVASSVRGEVVTAGADFRLRQDAFNYIPVKTGGYARGGENDRFRLRSRVWMEAPAGGILTFRARLTHEFVQHVEPSNATEAEWPDELVLDQLQVEAASHDGTLRVVAGRQDLMERGWVRVMGDGTPGDGGRTVYMDGLSGRWLFNDGKGQWSVFGVYDSAVDPLAIGNVNRELTLYEGGASGMDESGAGTFLRHALGGRAEGTLYYLWKHDSSWRNRTGERQGPEDIHTAGVQLEARPWEGMALTGDVAGQWGEREGADRRAMMAFLGARQGLWQSSGMKPYVGLSTVYLSGDRAETDRREDWNPLWSRWPWMSELVCFLYDADGAALWHNLTYTRLEGGLEPKAGHRLSASAGHMYAPEADGIGGGHSRGWMATAVYQFPLWKSTGCGALDGRLQADLFQPGNYYADENRTGYFLRWELTFAF